MAEKNQIVINNKYTTTKSGQEDNDEIATVYQALHFNTMVIEL